MYQIDEKVLKGILKRKFSALVRESCKRIEILRDNININTDEKADLFRMLVKELDYETMRQIEDSIGLFSKGVTFNVKFERPISK